MNQMMLFHLRFMKMEESLGVKLFKRSKHRVILTDEGRLLHRRAQEIVALADKAEKELLQGEDMISGEISIGCGETKNMAYLSQMIVSFCEQYPDVTFEIYTAISFRPPSKVHSVSCSVLQSHHLQLSVPSQMKLTTLSHRFCFCCHLF